MQPIGKHSKINLILMFSGIFGKLSMTQKSKMTTNLCGEFSFSSSNRTNIEYMSLDKKGQRKKKY